MNKKKRRAFVLGWILLMLLPNTIIGVKPVFDYSNNMRLVLLPADTKLGSVIYRLRASDGDEDYPLEFTAYGKKYLKNKSESSKVKKFQMDIL